MSGLNLSKEKCSFTTALTKPRKGFYYFVPYAPKRASTFGEV